MAKTSAGILLYRIVGHLEVLLVHPGGPFWVNKDGGAWSIPKGEFDPSLEDGLAAAGREFEEELGSPMPDGDVRTLGEVEQRAGKVVAAWALEGDLEPESVVSNTFTTEWPPRSGRMQEFPEVDRAKWVGLAEARMLINPAQAAFLDRLEALYDAQQ